MAVPDVSRATVISASVIPLNVAVKVKDDPAFSAIVVAEVVNVTVGALSFSVIVIVTDCVPLSVASPPETPSIEIIAVSSLSYTLSSVGVKLTVPVVLPALIVISSTTPLPSV